MKVKALRNFKDLENNVRRKKDNEFEVTEERFNEINSTKYGVLVEVVNEEPPEDIEIEDDTEFPKHTGGGYYELSNGEKVQGKEAAIEAEAELK